MNKHLALVFSSLALASAVAVAGDGIKASGSFEGGWADSWVPGGTSQTDSRFVVDNVDTTLQYIASDKTKVVVNNSFAANSGTAATSSAAFDTKSYYSRFSLSSSTFTLANQGAYLEHKCMDWLTTRVGVLSIPLGMESMASRFDNNAYYFSTLYAIAVGQGWNYDVGVTFSITKFGNLEIAAFDGRKTFTTSKNPTFALRWSHELKAGDMTITPVISGLAGAWNDGANDMAFTGGLGLKMSQLFANLEFFYAKVDGVKATRSSGLTTAAENKNWSFWFEPGFDAGFIKIAAKMDAHNDNVNTDFNLGGSLTKEFEDKLRVRFTYNHVNLKGDAGAHGNDFRVLLGTKF